MRSSRRAVVFVTATVSMALWSPSARAVGPGGWNHVGVGATSALPSLDGTVYAMNSDHAGQMYVGGNFTSAGGDHKARRIARWNGSSWSPLGDTPITNGAVFAIAYHAGKVYAGGTFLNAGGQADADFLAVWDGSTWAPFCTSTEPGSAFDGTVEALQVIGNTLYVGGTFGNGAGIDAADYLLACDLTTGVASSTVAADGDFPGGVYALTADSSGNLFAGGGFINLAGIPAADHVARYDGAWHAMGSGGGPGGSAVDSIVRSLHAVGTTVYVGTDAVDVAGIAQADHVVRWNGSSWSALGANTAGSDGWFPSSSFIYAMTSYGTLLVAGGSFQNANGNLKADMIAYFDGSHWRAIGSDGAGNGPINAQATSLATFDGKIFAGGNFTSAGGDTFCRSIASYALRQPDAAIGATTSGHFTGNGVYSATGANESRTVRVASGHDVSVFVHIENDGLTQASYTVSANGGAHGISARYFDAGNDVTNQVRTGTYTTGLVPSRSFTTLKVRVSTTHSAAAQTTFVVSARASSTTPDAVRAVVKTH